MDATLAKQLKDAGFPQRSETKSPYLPTLYELIAACGASFWSLRRTPDGLWIATGRIAKKDNQIPYYESSLYKEPDAAVAELFFAIKLNESR